jgi:NTE family protein
MLRCNKNEVAVLRQRSTTRRINLALQGGGAHGAFTWGVLDKILEDAAIDIGWISGTSAGALNGVALASGLATGGRDGARAALAGLWAGIAGASVPDLVKMNPLLAGPWATMRQSSALAQMATLFSPYDLNPLGADPLRRLLSAHIDIDALRTMAGPELLIAATDIATGRARLFRRGDISLDAILASACLPAVQHAVEIDGRRYWDGGYSANPSLLTLASESPVGDTLVVQLLPLVRPGRPTSARDIAHQVNHLAFVRPFVQELEAIESLRRIDRETAKRTAWIAKVMPPRSVPELPPRDRAIARHRFHLIDAGRFTASLPPETMGRPDADLLSKLFTAGRTEAGKWLDRSGADIGVRDTAEIAERLQRGAADMADPSPAVFANGAAA